MTSATTLPAHSDRRAKHRKVKTQPSNPVSATVAIAVLGVFVTYVPINGVSDALATIAQSTGASTTGLQ